MKILFTDLDGTLLNENSQISEYTKHFLDHFIAQGNRLVLSSGRPLDSIIEVKNDAGLNYPGMYIVANNGCLIYDCDSETPVIEYKLSLEQVRHLQEAACKHDLHIQTYSKDYILCNREDEEINYYRQKIHLPLLITNDYAAYLEMQSYLPYKMLAIHLTDHDKLEAFQMELSSWASDVGNVQMIFSNDKYLELFSAKGGKGSAVTALCSYLGIPIQDSFAAGDADNDISMIQAAGCGIAMSNAPAQVKKHADIITKDDYTQDGLAKIMAEIL